MPKNIPTQTRFTRLVVIERDAENTKYFYCQCDCGVKKRVRVDHLLSGKTLSCGCLAKEKASKRAEHMRTGLTLHHLSTSRSYGSWLSMKQRCLNKNNHAWPSYGGRGVSIYEPWVHDFKSFYNHLGERPEGLELDRIDNNGNYEPGNVRWANRKQQQNNRRVNKHINVGGLMLTVSQAAQAMGIARTTLDQRLSNGMNVDEALLPFKFLNYSNLPEAGRISAAKRKAATHCKHGHEFTPENTGNQQSGRYCKRCCADREIARNKAKRQALFAPE